MARRPYAPGNLGRTSTRVQGPLVAHDSNVGGRRGVPIRNAGIEHLNLYHGVRSLVNTFTRQDEVDLTIRLTPTDLGVPNGDALTIESAGGNNPIAGSCLAQLDCGSSPDTGIQYVDGAAAGGGFGFPGNASLTYTQPRELTWSCTINANLPVTNGHGSAWGMLTPGTAALTNLGALVAAGSWWGFYVNATADIFAVAADTTAVRVNVDTGIDAAQHVPLRLAVVATSLGTDGSSVHLPGSRMTWYIDESQVHTADLSTASLESFNTVYPGVCAARAAGNYRWRIAHWAVSQTLNTAY